MPHFSRSATRILCPLILVFCAALRPACAADHGQEKKLAEMLARAQQGYIEDQIELGAAYLLGNGVSADPAEAAHWYLRAAQSGSPEAQNEIGYFYQIGVGVPMDLERAAHWFQLASAGGMARAKVNLGVSYLYGTGVRKNPQMARQLFQEAIDKGSGLGAAYLGIMAWVGLGGPPDKDAAEHWFETGVKLHDAQAEYDLALLFASPDSKRHDLRKAVELLRSSAEKGYVAAKHALGQLIVNHPELAQSQGEASRELRQASEAGSWKASLLLGVMARDGNMIDADPRQAYYFFSLGALQGGGDAERLVHRDLDALKARLAADQQSAAADAAKAWFAQHRTPLVYIVKDNDKEKYFPLLASAESQQ
jgi:TPR repeat protein